MKHLLRTHAVRVRVCIGIPFGSVCARVLCWGMQAGHRPCSDLPVVRVPRWVVQSSPHRMRNCKRARCARSSPTGFIRARESKDPSQKLHARRAIRPAFRPRHGRWMRITLCGFSGGQLNVCRYVCCAQACCRHNDVTSTIIRCGWYDVALWCCWCDARTATGGGTAGFGFMLGSCWVHAGLYMLSVPAWGSAWGCMTLSVEVRRTVGQQMSSRIQYALRCTERERLWQPHNFSSRPCFVRASSHAPPRWFLSTSLPIVPLHRPLDNAALILLFSHSTSTLSFSRPYWPVLRPVPVSTSAL